MFKLQGDSSSLSQTLIQNAVKRWKTLRHPSIPLFVETYEYEGASYIVTEPLVPFDENALSKSELRWAIYTLTEFVAFLGDAHGIHGNLSESSLFMTPGHELKVGGLHWVTLQNDGPIFENWSAFASSTKFAEPKPQEGSPDWTIDVRYIGDYLHSWEGKLPPIISRFGKRWTPKIPNPVAPKVLLECEYWQKDKFVQYLVSLRDLPLKDELQREACLKQLIENLGNFSAQMQGHAILPALVHALSYAQSPSIIDLMMTIGQTIDKNEFTNIAVSELIPLFKSKERAIRMSLLGHMSRILPFLSKDVVNGEVFPNIVGGLVDSSAALRAATVISMCPMASFLTPQNMRALMIELRKLLKDNDPSIRCNSVICITKIAEYIDPETRTDVLARCFAVAAVDTFPQTRKAAIVGYRSCHQYFDHVVIATNVMPSLCPLCVDGSLDVKVAALTAMKLYVELLSEGVVDEAQVVETKRETVKYQEKPPIQKEPEVEVPEDEEWPEEWSDDVDIEPEPVVQPVTIPKHEVQTKTIPKQEVQTKAIPKQEVQTKTIPKQEVQAKTIPRNEGHAKPEPMKLRAHEKPQTRSKKPTISKMDKDWEDFDWDEPDDAK